MKILSLGWGVQSFTLAAMCALGEFEKPDYAIHADTGHEGAGTYEFAAEFTSWLEARGVRVVTVQNPTGGLHEIMKNDKIVQLPAYTRGGWIYPNYDDDMGEFEIFDSSIYTDEDQPWNPNAKGQLRRMCTHRWKIVPVRRWVQKHRNGDPVEMWLGISTDEALRMKPSGVQYITQRWPLIELAMSRNDCKAWLKEHGLPEPPRSSCVFCPYHSVREWREVQKHENDWEEAVKVDLKLRNYRPPYRLYIHPARIPLEEVDLRSETEKGQLSLWDEECEGWCGI